MSELNFAFQPGDALLIIDVQNDFCPGGALPIVEGDQVVPVLNAWINAATSAGTPVYLSRDWHPKHHPSFARKAGFGQCTACRIPQAQLSTLGCTSRQSGDRHQRHALDQDQNSAFDQPAWGAPAQSWHPAGHRARVSGGRVRVLPPCWTHSPRALP